MAPPPACCTETMNQVKEATNQIHTVLPDLHHITLFCVSPWRFCVSFLYFVLLLHFVFLCGCRAFFLVCFVSVISFTFEVVSCPSSAFYCEIPACWCSLMSMTHWLHDDDDEDHEDDDDDGGGGWEQSRCLSRQHRRCQDSFYSAVCTASSSLSVT